MTELRAETSATDRPIINRELGIYPLDDDESVAAPYVVVFPASEQILQLLRQEPERIRTERPSA